MSLFNDMSKTSDQGRHEEIIDALNRLGSNNAIRIPVLPLIGAAFIVMKLAGIGHVAGWSWWWVTAPFWGPIAFVIGILLIIAMIFGIIVGVGALLEKK